MKNPFNKKLFRVTNKSNNSKLIISLNRDGALKIAMKLRFAKHIDNLKCEDVSDSYITDQRLNKGLNYDLLEDGWLIQIFNNNITTWETFTL